MTTESTTNDSRDIASKDDFETSSIDIDEDISNIDVSPSTEVEPERHTETPGKMGYSLLAISNALFNKTCIIEESNELI